MLRKVALISMMIAAGALQGCGNDCDAAADDITAKYEECGITLPAGGDGDGGGECTDEAAKLATCLAACVTAADCKALDGSDPAALMKYGECTGKCLTP